jgi:hypothetical protein
MDFAMGVYDVYFGIGSRDNGVVNMVELIISGWFKGTKFFLSIVQYI